MSKMTAKQSIIKHTKKLINDRIISKVSMEHIEIHGVNDSIKELQCFIYAIIDYLDGKNV